MPPAVGLSIQRREKPQDVYYTPTDVVKAHLAECVPYYQKGDLVFDPFFGKGAYYNLYDAFFPHCRKDFTEIAMGKDFFEYDGKPDIVVSNPPFSLLTKIMKRLLQLRPKCISMLMGCMNLTMVRARMMDEAGYALVSLRIEKIDQWYSEMYLLTWVHKELSPFPTNVCRLIHGTIRHQNINQYVFPKDRKKAIEDVTADSSTPACV